MLFWFICFPVSICYPSSVSVQSCVYFVIYSWLYVFLISWYWLLFSCSRRLLLLPYVLVLRYIWLPGFWPLFVWLRFLPCHIKISFHPTVHLGPFLHLPLTIPNRQCLIKRFNLRLENKSGDGLPSCSLFVLEACYRCEVCTVPPPRVFRYESGLSALTPVFVWKACTVIIARCVLVPLCVLEV